MARGAAKAASWTSPRKKQARTRKGGAAQLQQHVTKGGGSKTTKTTNNKRKKVNESAAAANHKRTKTTNDPADGDKGKPDGDESDAVDSVTTKNKKKRVAGAGKKRKSIKPRKSVVQKLILDDIESTSESEEYVDEENDDKEDDEEEVNEDAVQDESSDDDGGQKELANNNDAENKEKHGWSSTSSDEDDSRGRRQRYNGYRREMEDEAEAAAMRAEARRKELNRSTQQGAVDPPNNSNPNVMLPSRQIIDVGISVRGLSKAESIQKQEKHVADRVTQFVKSDVFRRIKFINNDAMFQRAFQLVMNHEKVEPNKRVSFQMLYESCFNHALNTKRSSCEQTGGALARKAIAEFKQRGEEFYSFDEFCKLRRATTEREKNAFFWFFDTFLECVCGARQWRNAKKTTLVSKAGDGRGGKLVTKSDEAFGLLLIDNYMEKWVTVLAEEEKARANEVANNHDVDNTARQVGTNGNRQKKKAAAKIPGRYTAKKNGHCKYGGWSRDGTARFNELYNLVQDDRASAQSEQMERELMAFCRAQAGIDDNNAQHEQEGHGNNNAAEGTEALPVEAAWDLDD